MGPGRDGTRERCSPFSCSSSSLKVSMTMFGVEAFIEAMWDTGSNRTGSNWIGVFSKCYTGHVTSVRFFPYIPLEGHPETRDC